MLLYVNNIIIKYLLNRLLPSNLYNLNVITLTDFITIGGFKEKIKMNY